MDKTTTYYVYIGGSLVIVLLLCLVAQYHYQRRFDIKNVSDKHIAVKTAKGLVKVNALVLADEMSKLHAELLMHQGYLRTVAVAGLIDLQIENLKTFIKQNPKHELCKKEDRSLIVHNAVTTVSSINEVNDISHRSLAYNTILDDDIIDNAGQAGKFDVLLNNLDIAIQILRNDVCDNGVVDVEGLRDILHRLNAKAAIHNNLKKHTHTDTHSDTDLDHVSHKLVPGRIVGLSAAKAIRSVPRIALNDSRMSQIPNDEIDNGDYFADVSNEKKNTNNMLNIIEHARKRQMQSQEYETTDAIKNLHYTGVKKYSDLDLLA